jgi:hypothetical protein
VRDCDGQRHQFGRLVAGEAEHHALIARAAGVHALPDVRRLLLNRDHHAAGVALEAVLRARVAHFVDGAPHHIGNLHIGVRRNLTRNDRQPARQQRLHRYTRLRVLPQALVQNRVANLVCQLIGVTFRHALRSERLQHLIASSCSTAGEYT